MPTPRLTATKTVSPSPVLADGIVTYTIKIKNIGEINATGVSFKDLIPEGTTYVPNSTKLNGAAIADVSGTSAFVNGRSVRGATATINGVVPTGDTATVTFQVKVAAGQTRVCNQGEASFTSQAGAVLTDDPLLGGSDDPTCVDVLNPGVKMTKMINGDNADTAPGVSVPAGSMMDLSFEVTNTGNSPLNEVTVTDDYVPSSSIICPGSSNNVIPSLPAGRTITCSATVPAPAPGQTHSDTATVVATPPTIAGQPQSPVTDTDSAYAFTPNSPAINVSKLINDDPADVAPGVAVPIDTLMNIKFIVTNTGTTSLSNVTVTDDKVATILCPKDALASGEEMMCTANLKAPAPGVQHHNIATATGLPDKNPDGSQPAEVVNTDPGFAYVPVEASITMVKKINGQDINQTPGAIVEPGQSADVTFEVTNTSKVQLTGVMVTDDKLSGVTCPKNVLGVGETMTCTATLPGMLPGQEHMDTATVVAQPPANLDGTPAEPVTARDSEYARAKAAPSISVVKKINGDDAQGQPGVVMLAGSDMKVTFDVTNTGNLPLTGVHLDDFPEDSNNFGGVATAAPPAATPITCPKTDLAVGETMQCSTTIKAPPANVIHQDFAKAYGTPVLPSGEKQVEISDTDPAYANVIPTNKVEIIKKVNGEDADTAPGYIAKEGETLNFTFDVTNAGDNKLSDIQVTDDMVVGILCPKTELEAGESMQCTATGSAAAPGVQHTNVGTVSGQPAKLIDGTLPPRVTASNPANALVPAAPSLKLVKKINNMEERTAPGVEVGEGSEMVVSFEITNTGNVMLTEGKLVDDVYGEIKCPTNTLDPGYTTTCVTLQQAPAVGKQHVNHATATAQAPANPDGSPSAPVTATDLAYATAVPKPVPAISVFKSGNGLETDFAPGAKVAEGSTINYTFRVQNVGNTVLNNVVVTDDKITDIKCQKMTLAVAEEMTCTATGAAPQPGEQHTNIATVSGTSPDGVTVTDTNSFNAYVENKPSITLVKRINGDDANTAPGVTVPSNIPMTVSFEVVNTGNVALTNVTVGDNRITGISCPTTTLAAGEKTTCTATMPPPAPGVLHSNLGYVTADTPINLDGSPNTPVTAQDPAFALVPAAPSISVVKKINGGDGATAPGVVLTLGDTMQFTFDITNNGNVPLTGITVSDDQVTNVMCPASELEVGTTMQCTGSLSAPEAGVQHQDTVTVSAQPPVNYDGTPSAPVTATDTAFAMVPSEPGLSVTKSLNGDPADKAPGITVAEGSTMSVTVHVVNTGNTPLTMLSVTDDAPSNLDCPKTELAVGEEMYCLGNLPAPKSGELHKDVATAIAFVKNPDGTPGAQVTASNPAYATGTDAPNPALMVEKKINGDDANQAPGVTVGEGTLMNVTFKVSNIGNTQLRNIQVKDDKIAVVNCPADTLDPGTSMDCAALLAAPAVGAQHDNLATATGVEVKADGTDGDTVQNTDPAFAVSDPKPAPSIQLLKRINGDDADQSPGVQVAPGSAMNISVEIRNTGNTRLEQLQLTDTVVPHDAIVHPTYKHAFAGHLVPWDGVLLPGEMVTGMVSWQGPAVGGIHENTATIAAVSVANDGTKLSPVTDTDSAFAYANGSPALSVVKRINGDDANSAPGIKVEPSSTMNITIDVTNTGDVDLTGVTVTDDRAANVSCPTTVLKAGASMTCTAKLAAPEANVQHVDTATVSATPPANPDGTVPELAPVTDQAYAYAGTFSGISIQKRINGDDADTAPGVLVTAGSMMNIEFVVTNTGSVPLADVRVTDSKIADGISCPKSTLNSGESMTCTATYPAPAANGMTHEDVASAEGTPPMNLDGTYPPSPKASDVGFAQTPGVAGLSMSKKINGEDANIAPGVLVTPGTPLNVTFDITNTGSVDLTDVAIADAKIPGTNITCPQTTLAAGASMSCTATVPGLKNLESYDNVATVTGTPPVNPDGSVPTPPTATDEAHAHTPGVAGIAVKKMINTDDANVAPGVAMQSGETMYFTYLVTNTGSTVLNDVTVTDDKVTDISCPKTSLNVGEEMTCTAQLAAPADTGQTHENTATVTGMPPMNPDGSQPVPPTATDKGFAYTPGLAKVSILKKLNGDDADALPGVSIDAFAPMDFTFTVTNEGQVPLTDVTVTDDQISNLTCLKSVLAPGESLECTAQLFAPASGTHTNTATVIATPTNADGTAGTPVSDKNSANATIIPAPAPGTPGISVVKKVNGADANTTPGLLLKSIDLMEFTYEVANTGTAPLVAVNVTDDKGLAVFCPQNTLAVGESMVCTASAPAPYAGEQYTNIGTATGTAVDSKGELLPNGAVTATDPANALVPVTLGHPQMFVVKKIDGQDSELAPGVAATPGQPLNVTFTVTNSGDVEIMGIALSDDAFGAVTCPQDSLLPGETMECTAMSLDAPAIGKQHTNTATVVGTPVPNPGELPPPPISDTDIGHAYTPAIEVVKKINGDDANSVPGATVEPGSQMQVTFDVTNRGKAALNNIALTDDVITTGISCPKAELIPGETMQCTASYPAPTQGNTHTNTATVTANDPSGMTVTAQDTAHAIANGEPQEPGVAIVKKIDGADANAEPGVYVREGDTMNVTFEVTNTGNSALANIVVQDDKISAVNCGQTTLLVGETMTCTATAPAPQTGELHKNTATVTADGIDQTGKVISSVTATDEANATSLAVQGTGGIVVVKKINGHTAPAAPGIAVEAGKPMAVTFEVTNTGDLELTQVTVSDDKAQVVSCPKNVLAAGETMTCTADVMAPAVGEQHVDVAKAVGTPQGQPPVEASDLAHAYAPAIGIVKKINGVQSAADPVIVPNDVDMIVTFEVTNHGLAALTGVKVSDDIITSGISCPKDTLLPAETMTCDALYPAPAQGVEHTNTATATGTVPTNPDGSEVPPVTAQDSARAVAAPKPEPGVPGVKMVKKIGDDDANSAPGVLVVAGTMMDITFEVTNVGTAMLTGVTVTDDMASVSCPQTELAIGETMVCTAQLDAPVAGGTHHDTGTVVATGVDRDGTPLGSVTSTDEAFAHVAPDPEHAGVVIVKKINGQDASIAPGLAVSAGQMMDFTFEVINTGDVELMDIQVTDNAITGITCPATSLAAGETMICEAQAAAPEVGQQHSNVATVTATPADPTLPPVEDEDNAHAYVPGVKIIKKIGGDDAETAPVTVPAGIDMLVTFEVTNTGLAGLNDVHVTDNVINSGITCPTDSLQPGETMLCSAKLAPPAEGTTHINEATVAAKVPANPDGSTVPDVADTDKAQAVVAITPTDPGKPAVGIIKKIGGADANTAPGTLVTPGDDLKVTFDVTNIGKTQLRDITVTDDKLAAVTCAKTELVAGESMICTGTLPGLKAGETHTNTGTVTARGYDLEGKPLETVEAKDSAHARTTAKQGNPQIVVVKKINGRDGSIAPGVAVDRGSEMVVTFEATNTGDVDLIDVAVTDNVLAVITCPATELAVGATMTCSAKAKVPEVGQQHVNVAKVVGTPKPADGLPQLPPVSHEDHAYAFAPGVEVVKLINGEDANEAPGVAVKPGTTMNIEFKVTNIGFGALTKVTVKDDVITSGISCPKQELNPGETMTCVASLPAPQDGQQHHNTATVEGNPQTRGDVVPPKLVTDTDPAYAHGTTKPVEPPTGSTPPNPLWLIPIVPLVPIVGGLFGSSGSSTGPEPVVTTARVALTPGTPAPSAPALGAGAEKGKPVQPEQKTGKKGLAATGVQVFGLVMVLGVLVALVGITLLMLNKKRR